MYNGARLIRMANARKNRANYPSMRITEPILCYIFVNGGELCTGQPYNLSGRCELARVKLCGLYCTFLHVNNETQ